MLSRRLLRLRDSLNTQRIEGPQDLGRHPDAAPLLGVGALELPFGDRSHAKLDDDTHRALLSRLVVRRLRDFTSHGEAQMHSQHQTYKCSNRNGMTCSASNATLAPPLRAQTRMEKSPATLAVQGQVVLEL